MTREDFERNEMAASLRNVARIYAKEVERQGKEGAQADFDAHMVECVAACHDKGVSPLWLARTFAFGYREVALMAS